MADVALVCENVVPADGQGRAMLELARALVGAGHDVTVYAARVDPAVDVRWRRVPRGGGPQPVVDATFFAAATAELRRAGHDTACVMGAAALPPGPFTYYAQFSHAGWRATWAGGGRPSAYHRAHARLQAALQGRVARRAAAVVACSEGTARELGVPGAAVVPNGVDVDALRPASPAERADARASFGLGADDFVVAFAGEYRTGRKGLDTLLAAVAAGPPSEHLLVAGDGDPRRVRGDRAHALGFVPVEGVLAAADVVAVPSRYEPFSLVALEAAARALPVVVSDRVGAAEHLGDAAVVVPPGDPAAWRAALDGLAADPVRRADLGAAARAAAEALAWPRVAARVAEVVAP